MKRLHTLCLFLLSLCAFGQTPVTFNVNMVAIVPSDSLHIVGNFQDPNYDNIPENLDYQNWTPSASSGLMSDPDMDFIYSVTLFLFPGRYEFKFLNGNDWPTAEVVPQTCTVEVDGNTNRQIMVGSEPVTDSVCYGECADCGQNTVRLRVDMSTFDFDGDVVGGELVEDIHPEGVHVNGSFHNWSSFLPLQDWDGNKIWEGLITVSTLDPIEFKFINGPDWIFPSETIFGICGADNSNRLETITDASTVLPIYCWNSCDPCQPTVSITFNVDMNSSSLDTSSGVRLMGTFTNWSDGAMMSDDDGDGIWTITLDLPVGTHEYKFRVGTDGWEGIANRQLLVMDNTPQVLPAVCFNSSEPCDPGALSDIGCTDPMACNYDPNATSDNGSCYFNCNPCDGSPAIWQDDFSSPNNWTIAHDGTFNSNFQIGVGLVSAGQFGTPAINSTTAANGYALYNSEGYNNAGVAYEQAHITTASPIDLSAYPSVILQFQTQYRRFIDEQTYLIISTDGVTWPTLDDPTMDVSAMPGVYKVWEDGELTTSVSPGNPVTRSFNISEVAGGASQVWVRFQFTGIWGYAWYIDDVRIKQQLSISSTLNSARLNYQNTTIEYGRIPVNQLPSTFSAVGEFVNDGTQILTGVEVSMQIRESNSNSLLYNNVISTYPQVLPGESVIFNQNLTWDYLYEGRYDVIFNLSSNEDMCLGILNDNTVIKKIEVTQATMGIDALGLYPAGIESVSSLGTSSFTDNADEMMLFNYYELLETTTVYGAEILLAPGTVAGSELWVQLHDTIDVYTDNVYGSIEISDGYMVTDLDIANGSVSIPFIIPVILEGNGYYLSVTLYSNGNNNDIRILDDVTVPQPTAASLIYLPNDGVVYSNGNAFGIRMLLEATNFLVGCTSPSACNYNPSATTDNGSCLFQGDACNDGNSATINDVIQSNCSCLGIYEGSECTASNYNFGNTDFGIYPAESSSLIDGCLNEFYSQSFYILVPTDAGSIDPLYTGIPISNMFINGITMNGQDISSYGLSSVCDIPICLFNAGEQHCISLLGTPNQAGLFSLSINITVFIDFFGPPIDLVYSFDGYSLNVLDNCGSSFLGCTDAEACNFDPTANNNDGSCLYSGTTCSDNNPGTMLDQVNANCNCQGTPFNYGTIATTTTNLCSGIAPQAISLSAPLNLQAYAVQWYYSDGANSCPSGNSTAGWNILAGENGLTYTPTEFIGTRTYACFIAPSEIYGIPEGWANGCRTISYSTLDAQTIIGNPNIAPFSTVTYAVNPTAGHTYNWSVTNGAITTGQGTNTIQVLWGQNGPYQVTLAESNGICSDESSLLVVNSNCSISVLAIAEGGNSFCPGTSTTLQAITDETGITYQWYFNGVEINGATQSSLEISSGGNYQVLIAQAACTAVSQTLFITTLPAVVLPQLTINSDTPGCSGGTVIISAEGGTFDSYLWNNGETTSTIEVTESGEYSVDLADANGCHATAGPVSVNLALQEPLPICIVSVDPATNNNIIVWEPLQSDVTSAYAIYKETNIADEYASIGSVDYGSDGLFTDLNSNASVQASRYKLALIDTCGIESFLTPQHKTIHLTSNLGLNNTINLIWTHYEGFFFGSYNIYRGDAANNLTLLTTIASNLSSYTDLNPLAGPTFYVIEVEGISCDPTRDVVFSRSNVIQLDANAVMEKPAAHCFVWPNPANDVFNLQIDNTLLGSAWLVRTMLGQEIASFQTLSAVHTIDASNWAPGVYLLENKNTSGSVLRLVKE